MVIVIYDYLHLILSSVIKKIYLYSLNPLDMNARTRYMKNNIFFSEIIVCLFKNTLKILWKNSNVYNFKNRV